MFQYRQVLQRLRQADSDRDIARSGLMGRPKVAVFGLLAAAQGWLKPEVPLPDDAAIAAVLGAPRRATSTISSVKPFRGQVKPLGSARRQRRGGPRAAVARARIWRQLFRRSADARADSRQRRQP
jgi:hypothetical protein